MPYSIEIGKPGMDKEPVVIVKEIILKAFQEQDVQLFFFRRAVGYRPML